MQVDVSFETWKALTNRLVDEKDSYDAVIRRLMQQDPSSTGPQDSSLKTPQSGAIFKGVFLPDGTQLRATHRGEAYLATIIDGHWIDSKSGEKRTSPSQAAAMITQGGVNGWLFWLVKRPQDAGWSSLNELRSR